MNVWCAIKDCPYLGPHSHTEEAFNSNADIRKATLEVLLEIRDLLKEMR